MGLVTIRKAHFERVTGEDVLFQTGDALAVVPAVERRADPQGGEVLFAQARASREELLTQPGNCRRSVDPSPRSRGGGHAREGAADRSLRGARGSVDGRLERRGN